MSEVRQPRFQRGDKVRINGTKTVGTVAQIDRGYAVVLESLTGYPRRVAVDDLRLVTS